MTWSFVGTERSLNDCWVDVWDYQDGGHEKTHLPKWLFALTLAAAVTCTSSPSDIVVPVMTALAPAPEKLSIDNVSSQNVAEDLDYRIARHTDSVAGWRAFLSAHPDGPTRRPPGPRSTTRSRRLRHSRTNPRRRRKWRTRSGDGAALVAAGHGRGGAAAGPAG